MNSAEILQLCNDFSNLGFQYVIFVIVNAHEIKPLETFAETIIPQVALMD